jgi:multiple sugar transport system ATP-binding protein
LSSRIAVMNKGLVEQFDEPKTIYNNPQSMFVASFMGSPAMNMMFGDLSSQNGRPAIRLGAGEHGVTIPLPQRFLLRALPPKLALGIRPEHVRRVRGATDAQMNIKLINTHIDVVEPTGGETLVIVKVGGRDLTVKLEADDPAAAGDPITLAIDMARVSLFDPATGLSLA